MKPKTCPDAGYTVASVDPLDIRLASIVSVSRSLMKQAQIEAERGQTTGPTLSFEMVGDARAGIR